MHPMVEEGPKFPLHIQILSNIAVRDSHVEPSYYVLTARGTQNEVPKHLTLEKVHALGICQISYPKLHGHAYHEVVALT